MASAGWSWNNGGNSFLPYPQPISDRIEAAFQEGRPNVNLGSYWIDFMKGLHLLTRQSFSQLEQHRSDNPTRVRKVRRDLVVPPAAPSPAQASASPLVNTSSSVDQRGDTASGRSHGWSNRLSPQAGRGRTHRQKGDQSDDSEQAAEKIGDEKQNAQREPPRKHDDNEEESSS